MTCSEAGMTAMNDIVTGANAALPGLIEQAPAALATATTAAEVLDAKSKAGFAYTTAKAAARFAEAKNAHDAIVVACHKASRENFGRSVPSAQPSGRTQ
jgi:hypothetical protein